MKGNERFVFDTNVIVSALLFAESKPAQAFFTALGEGKILVSLPILQELNEVLSRSKFDRYVTRAEREKFLGLLVREAELVETTEQIHICRDPKDDKFLDVAINGHATRIISGDQDLLAQSPFRGIHIVTPDNFLNRAREK